MHWKTQVSLGITTYPITFFHTHRTFTMNFAYANIFACHFNIIKANVHIHYTTLMGNAYEE